MESLVDAAAVVGMFIARVGIPLAITFAVAYGLKRLDARWQREAQERSGSLADVIAAKCQFAGRTNPVCWVARRQAEGQMAAECRSCSLFALRKVA
jgi:hypothetical protein